MPQKESEKCYKFLRVAKFPQIVDYKLMSSEIQRQLAKIFKVTTVPQLVKALDAQLLKAPYALANALLQIGAASETDLCKVLALSYTDTWVNFSKSIFDLRALSYMPIKLAKQYKALPVAMNEQFLVLWSTRQKSPKIKAMLEEKSERKVLIYLAFQHSFLESLDDIYLSFHRRDMSYCGPLAKGFEPGLDLFQAQKSPKKQHFIKFLSQLTSLNLGKTEKASSASVAKKLPSASIVSPPAVPAQRLSTELKKIVGDLEPEMPIIEGFDDDILSEDFAAQTLSQDLTPKKVGNQNTDLVQNLARADFYFVQKNYGSAKEHCLKYFRKNPSDPNVQLLLGKIAMQEGNWLIARDYHEQSIDLNPISFEAHSNLALIYERLNKKAIALSTWVLAIKFAPSSETREKLIAHVQKKYPDFKRV